MAMSESDQFRQYADEALLWVAKSKTEEEKPERALSTIRQTGTAAALEECSGLADQINAKLLQCQSKDFAQAEVEALQAFLERAAAVLKKL
jgi:hypothetical protein